MNKPNKLDELQAQEDYLLQGLLHELNRGDILRSHPELQEAYTKYMAAVSDTQRYCYAQVAAMNRDRGLGL